MNRLFSKRKPYSPPYMQLFYLQILNLATKKEHRCKTLALNLDEAMRRARYRYGAIRLLSCGTRDVRVGCDCLGTGVYLPSPHDGCIDSKLLFCLQESSTVNG